MVRNLARPHRIDRVFGLIAAPLQCCCFSCQTHHRAATGAATLFCFTKQPTKVHLRFANLQHANSNSKQKIAHLSSAEQGDQVSLSTRLSFAISYQNTVIVYRRQARVHLFSLFKSSGQASEIYVSCSCEKSEISFTQYR